MQELSDKDLNRQITSSGIPKSYARPDASLTKCGPAGARILDWLGEGRDGSGYHALRKSSCVVEIVSDSTEAADAFYLMARAAILHAIPVYVAHVLDLLDGDGIDPAMWDIAEDRTVLFVEGLSPLRQGELSTPQLLAIEWFTLRWLAEGKAVVFLHERAILDAPALSSRFKKRCASYQKLFITNV